MQSPTVNTKSKSGVTWAHSLKTGRHGIGLMKHEYVINSLRADFIPTLTRGKKKKKEQNNLSKKVENRIM